MMNKLDKFAPVGLLTGLVNAMPTTDEITAIVTAISTILCASVTIYNTLSKIIKRIKNKGKENDDNDIQ